MEPDKQRTRSNQRSQSVLTNYELLMPEQFLVLFLLQLVNQFYVLVGDFLHLLQALTLVVFRDLVLLEELFEPLVRIASRLTHRVAALFGLLVDVTRQLLATIVGQSRNGYTYHLAIVGRVEPEVRAADRLLDGAHPGGITRLGRY